MATPIIGRLIASLGQGGRLGAAVGRVAGDAALAAAAIPAFTWADENPEDQAYFQENLMFPDDLVNPGRNYYLTLRFMRYVKRSIYENSVLEAPYNSGSIRLPIPKNIQDNTNITYSNENLGPAVGGLLDAFSGDQPGLRAGGVDAIRDALLGLGLEKAESANPRFMAGVQALQGQAINPFQTMAFKNPNFKRHSFNWLFVPSSKEESETLNRIIKTIQYHMLPSLASSTSVSGGTSGTGTLWNYPSIVKLYFSPSDTFLYRFKPCVVESLNVDHAPASTPAFYKTTQAPAAIRVSINLIEIELWSKRDFNTLYRANPSAPPSEEQLRTPTPAELQQSEPWG